MKVFISHSGKDAETAVKLASLMENIDIDVTTFCSSVNGHIPGGANFVRVITQEMENADVFIPLLSQNYFESKFCLIELGFAYSYLNGKMGNENVEYIYPMTLYPLDPGTALNRTPMDHLQTVSVNDLNSLVTALRIMYERYGIVWRAGSNNKVMEFVKDINQNIVEKDAEELSRALILLCKSGEVPGSDSDYLRLMPSNGHLSYSVGYNAFPFGKIGEEIRRPQFLSFVFKYADDVNLHDIPDSFSSARLCIRLNNCENALKKIKLEIKHSGAELLFVQEYDLREGENEIFVSLSELQSEKSKVVSEICLVICPDAYRKDKGVIEIGKVILKG